MRMRRIIVLLAVLMITCLMASCASDPREAMDKYIAEGNYNDAVKLYNSKIVDTEYEAEYDDLFLNMIDETVAGWSEEAVDYQTAEELLEIFTKIENDELCALANSNAELIQIENTGNECLAKAEEAYAQDNLPEAMHQIRLIDKSYSQYDSAEELYQTCEEIVLTVVEKPYSSSDCKEYIELLDTYIEQDENDKFIQRKDELLAEVKTFDLLEEKMETIGTLYAEGKEKEAFDELAIFKKEYPQNDLVELYVKTFQDAYIISITQNALTLSEQKEYEEAVEMVETANTIYPCEDFSDLIDAIKRQGSILYRLKSSIVDKFMAFTHDSKGETLSVKDMGSKAGAYVVASGKKLVLGDYTDDEVTVLSFSGDMLASLAGADLLMDIRDLSYDVVNWGKDEYFMVRLAADTVALLPVVGLVKYLDAKAATKAFKKFTGTADEISEAAKNTARIADTVSAITKTHKKYDTIGDAIGQAQKESKFNVVKGRHVRYAKVKTINQMYKDKVYNGVLYKEVKVNCANGRIRGVFPQFEYVYQTTLPKSLLKKSSNAQFKYCNEELLKAVKKNKKLKDSFTPEQLAEIENGVISNAPSGWTWHHNEQEGIMQLVDAETHRTARHTGGNAIWGHDSVKTAA